MGSQLTEDSVLVFVPGSFCPPHFYSATTDALSRNGIQAVVVKTPSVGRRDPLPPATMTDDAVAVQSVVEKLADEGKTVVIMAHSYGGVPATQSINGLSKAQRVAKGKTGGVSKLVYCSALVAQEGQSTIAFMGQLPDFLTLNDDYMQHDPVPNGKATFSDLSDEEGLKWAKQMPDHSTASFQEGLSYLGYEDVDIGYLVCEEDQIIPLAYQQAMIDYLQNEVGKSVQVERLQSGHCPNASQPEKLAEALAKFM